MIIEAYNIRLEKIKKEDIELIRKWRNYNHVRKYMEYKNFITKEMQKEWYVSNNNNNNMYFIICYNNDNTGVINAKNIDWEHKSFEIGLFLSYEKIQISIIPILAILCFLDAFFLIFDFKKIISYI